MGAFKSKFVLGDQEFDLRWFRVGTDRGMNVVGKPTTSTRGAKFEGRVASSNVNALAEAMVICEHTPFDCYVEIMEGESTGVMKKIALNHCVMVEYRETFDADSELEASTYISITANSMEIGNALLQANWTNTHTGSFKV